MPKFNPKYKIWIHVEMLDDENDIYVDVNEIPIDACGRIDTIGEAIATVKDMLDHTGVPYRDDWDRDKAELLCADKHHRERFEKELSQ